jgi:hypothetical protein
MSCSTCQWNEGAALHGGAYDPGDCSCELVDDDVSYEVIGAVSSKSLDDARRVVEDLACQNAHKNICVLEMNEPQFVLGKGSLTMCDVLKPSLVNKRPIKPDVAIKSCVRVNLSEQSVWMVPGDALTTFYNKDLMLTETPVYKNDAILQIGSLQKIMDTLSKEYGISLFIVNIGLEDASHLCIFSSVSCDKIHLSTAKDSYAQMVKRWSEKEHLYKRWSDITDRGKWNLDRYTFYY